MNPFDGMKIEPPTEAEIAASANWKVDSRQRNCLTYWFPKLEAVGVPVPKTRIVDAGENWYKMVSITDGSKQFPKEYAEGHALIQVVAKQLNEVASEVGGFPAFLRTGQFSGKHRAKDTCRLLSPHQTEEHVANLMMMSEEYGMFGELPYRFWCIREYLPIGWRKTLPAYGDMPVIREIRAFVKDGKVICHHPYWPRKSIEDGMTFSYGTTLEQMSSQADRMMKQVCIEDQHLAAAMPIIEKVAETFAGDGAWSVDALETDQGWFITDMAIAGLSFHWDGCEKAAELGRMP